MRSTAVASLAILLIAPAAFAQGGGYVVTAQQKQALAEQQNAEGNMKRAAEVAATRVPLERPIKGAPYSADVITEMAQTLADGNHISRQQTSRVYRDGEGRTRREQNGAMTVAVAGGPVSIQSTAISIIDPVGGYSYSLNPEQKIAWRTPIGTSKELLDKLTAAAAQRSSQPMTDEQKAQAADAIKKLKAEEEKLAIAAKERAAQSADAPSKASNEVIARSGGPGGRGGWTGYAYAPSGPLEHKTIEGLAVEGRHTSETIPAGKVGNELPITITSEEWTSTDLKVLVLTKHNDPRTGESTYRLSNVVRAEPDPSLFMVPPDYAVKDTNIRRNNE